MMPSRPIRCFVFLRSFAFVGAACLLSCKEKSPPSSGLVVDAAVAVALSAEAGAVDLMTCSGCQAPSQGTWTFEGIYRDPACTDPLAQSTTPPCAMVPAVGPASLTYVDEMGLRKAGEVANVTLAEQIPPETPRFRKTAKGCVRANEGAVDVTPMNCVGSRVCRDAAGALACTACRTLAGGCPDFEETRTYSAITDPGIKGQATAAGGGNLARLRQCCAQLAVEAKRLGPSPEAGLLATASAQCLTIVNQAGPNGTAPELGVIRGLLAGRTIPAVCSGF